MRKGSIKRMIFYFCDLAILILSLCTIIIIYKMENLLPSLHIPSYHASAMLSPIRKSESRNHSNTYSLSHHITFNLGYKVTVADVIKSSKKVNDDWGVKEYQFPKFNAFL